MSKYLKKKSNLIWVKISIAHILILAVAIMITFISQQTKYEQQIAVINANHEEEMATLRAELQEDYEIQMAELVRYYEYGGDIAQIEKEAEHIARVLYGTARNHADSDKRAVVWCILNRVEYHSYPDTIIEVCEQPKQWIGYSSENPVLTNLYDLALAELKIWYNGGHRPMDKEYIYLSWSSEEILLRDTFEESKSTNYWRMK